MRIVLLLFILSACRTLQPDHSSPSNAADIQKALGIDAGDPFVATGEDLPTVGRSLFDELTAVPRGDRLEQVVPFPLETLLQNFDSHMLGPHVGTLIPRGRSLQRNAAKQSPFVNPRVVIAMVDPPQPAAPLLRDRLYLGYVESTKQLEIISYNEAAGRYEFQVVRNYGPGLTPIVRYAPRALCLSCHQNQAPIFSTNPWSETNGGSTFIGEKIAAAHGGSAVYQTLPIATGPESFGQVARIDESVERANLLAIINRLWIDGCGRDAPEAPACRARVMTLALQAKAGICNIDRPFDRRFCSISWHDPALAQSTEAEFRRNWYHFWPTGLKIPNPKIASRSVEAEFQGGPDTALQKEFNATSLRDPVSILEQADLEKLVKGIKFFMLAHPQDRDLLFALGGQKPEAINQALQTLAHGSSKSLGAGPFERTVFLAELRQALGNSGTPPASSIGTLVAAKTGTSTASIPTWWRPQTSDDLVMPQEVRSASMDPSLRNFVEQCGRCHLRAIPWLGGEDGKPSWENIGRVAERVLFRLNWEAHAAPGDSMPPSNSLEYRYLKDHPELRKQMLQTIESHFNKKP